MHYTTLLIFKSYWIILIITLRIISRIITRNSELNKAKNCEHHYILSAVANRSSHTYSWYTHMTSLDKFCCIKFHSSTILFYLAIDTIVVSPGINKPHSKVANEWGFCFSPKIGQGRCHQRSGIDQVLISMWTPQSNKGIMMYNISFIEFGVTDEPVEVDETWTRTMYICLFLGGFWCGTVTFVMLLAIHTHCERFRTRQHRGPVTTVSPFWSDWRSSIS